MNLKICSKCKREGVQTPFIDIDKDSYITFDSLIYYHYRCCPPSMNPLEDPKSKA